MGERILVVDDEAVLRANLVRYLRHGGHDVVAAGSGEEAIEQLGEQDFGLVVTDLRMPGMSGLELLERIVTEHPETLVLLITAYASVESAVGALRLGAQDYLLKPLVLEEVGRKVARLFEHRHLEHRVRRLRQELEERFTGQMVATSEPMQRVTRMLRRAAKTPSNVLVVGESGTGKELAARALHDWSDRSDRDFIPVNLAAQPADLVDAMLFGHERGAYTGAQRSRPGVFRSVDGGTVFIDEVGDLPLPVQVKLLRVIENREVLPIGSDRPVPVDFRLVVATNRSLEQGVENGTFREDLFFRLNVLRIELPPLRERVADIGLLAAHFVDKHARSMGRPTPRLDNETLRALQLHRWPGNVRELSNVVERAVLFADSPWITSMDLGLPTEGGNTLALKPAVEAFERRHVKRVLDLHGGDKRATADALGVHLATLYRMVERLGL